MMAKQEVFDTAYEHLIKQGTQSINDKGMCAYRGPNGLMCGVGVLIKDEHYFANLEGLCAKNESVMKALLLSGVIDDMPGEHFKDNHPIMSLLSDIQHVHDSTDPMCWHRALRNVAESHKLSCPAGIDLTHL